MRSKIRPGRFYGALVACQKPLSIVAWFAAALAGVFWVAGGSYQILLLCSAAIALTVLVFFIHAIQRRPSDRGSRNRALEVIAHLLLPAGGYSVFAHLLRTGGNFATIAIGLVVLILVTALLFLSRHAWKRGVRTAHLPGAPKTQIETPATRRIAVAFGGLLAANAVLFLTALAPLPSLAVFLVAPVCLLGGAIVAYPILRFAANARRTARALAKYEPVLVIFHDGLSQLHWDMWVPYLLQSGSPLLQIATREKNFQQRAVSSDVPIVLVPELTDRRVLRSVCPASVKAIFYPRNAKLNSLIIAEFPRVQHVFLHHGDGDKPASSNKSAGRHDILVVAGQAAIDRYAMRGVEIPREKFRILGRPVAANFHEDTTPPSAKNSVHVLYAPTWKGLNEEVNFSSLEYGPEIIERVLARDVTVIFRPHPSGQHYAPHKRAISEIKSLLEEDTKRTGRKHLWGAVAEKRHTLADVANISDLMIADVSGVITDYMQTLKPFIMVATKHGQQEFIANFPSARSAYVVEAAHLATLEAALDAALGPDPLQPMRVERRNYYLGGYSGNDSARAFVGFLRELAEGKKP